MLPKNFCPVSQLPIWSKVCERAVFLQLIDYLETNGLIHPNHHGGRATHNTATAMIQMYDHWIEGIEEGKLVGAMMVDLSSAFDMVKVPILLEKMELLGMDEKLPDYEEAVCVH